MRDAWWRGVAAGLLGAALVVGCGGGQVVSETKEGSDPQVNLPDPGGVDAGGGGGGSTDAGQPAGGGGGGTPDAGPGDAGPGDAGPGDAGPGGGPVDAGPGDAGAPLTPVELPTLPGWTFYGPEQGAPKDVLGVTEDQGGNVWVAGGEEGLFLLRKGSTTFERFTMEDGLRPYGYMPDGSDPQGPHVFKVVSVAGGPAGTVFVGYEGHPRCESDWDDPPGGVPDPAVYKSGDADRVELRAGGGIHVVHYDLFSGPGVVDPTHYKWWKDTVVGGFAYKAGDPKAREKLCKVWRIAYDATTNSVWFGSNHGVARAKADLTPVLDCDGQLRCSGVEEHLHPAISGSDGLLTDGYYGLSPAPNGDVWIGGAIRSARVRYMSNDQGPRNFWRAQALVEWPQFWRNRLDIWEDPVPECDAAGNPLYPAPKDRKDDHVSGMAAMPDGSVWVSSFRWGLAHLDPDGGVLRKVLAGEQLSAVARDPSDGSIWTGLWWGGGLIRVAGASITRSGPEWGELWGHSVWDIQSAGTGEHRRMLVAFRRTDTRTGAVGIHQLVKPTGTNR